MDDFPSYKPPFMVGIFHGKLLVITRWYIPVHHYQILNNLSSWNPLVGTPNYHIVFSCHQQTIILGRSGREHIYYIYIFIYVYIGDILLTCIPSISLLYHHFVWFYITISGYVFRFIPLLNCTVPHSYPCFIDIYIWNNTYYTIF